MKKQIITFLLIFINIGLLASDQFPVIYKGYIDFSDFSFDSPIELNGLWKFKWMEDSNSFIKMDFDDTNWDTINVPSHWNDKGKGSFGYCWLRLRIKNNPDYNLGFYIYNANTSYSLFMNEKLVMANGIPGNTRKSSTPQIISGIYTITQRSVYPDCLENR